MSILGFVKETAGKVFNVLLNSTDKVITFGAKVAEVLTPENIVNTAKVMVAISVIYSVTKKAIPFFVNFYKGTKKQNRPFTATILASGGTGSHAKEARRDISDMTANAAKAVRNNNAGIDIKDTDFFGEPIKDDKLSDFNRDDRALLNNLKKKSSLKYNEEDVQKENFLRNTPDYLDRVMGRAEKLELPEIQNKYFRDYLACNGGNRKKLKYTFKDEYLVIGDTIITPATIADEYLKHVEEVLAWMRSERTHPKAATMFEYMFYNETLPAVAQAGFSVIKDKAKEQPMTLGEFKAALNWFIQNSHNFRPDYPMQYFSQTF